MLYIIDGKVTYDATNGTLSLIGDKTNDCTHLTSIANKILHYLVLHHCELVTRDRLFDEVWEKEGIPASSNTLSQYISLLRKVLSGYLGDKNIIVTVPRAGYYLSKEITVSALEKQQSKSPYFAIIITTIFCMIFFTSAIFLYTTKSANVIPRKIGVLNECIIYDISGIKGEVTDTFNYRLAKEIFDSTNQKCEKNSAFYIFVQETLHLHKPARVLFSKCIEWSDYRDNCQNFYYYTWVLK
ncbi:transcriptional regulator [Escherichia coli]|uniref:winged helix-turn-helix domain-containing protein n=1 Tax=Escherichia coli TaxID=562 RepID=UPI001558226D|nr:helix-turn-helix domain-containing protein [Escherichia coli]ELD1760645.1 winged helix-turn-helix domain-containing protein [Escherichia coli]ELD1782852.1 winged helix-turn-helix domain-containing protein [Escherichia coli]ELJ4030579.1 winged helix-turn-helix domain-containing protein [Escherichia coli]